MLKKNLAERIEAVDKLSENKRMEMKKKQESGN